MTYGNVCYEAAYGFSEDGLGECFAYAREHDLRTFPAGIHEIDGKRLFVNIVEYTTTTPEERFWEAHREYLDIHILLDGEEQIDVAFVESMKQGTYVPEDDFLPMEGKKSGCVVLHKGDFLICYPHDAHRTAVMADQPSIVKKAIFKLKCTECV